MLLKNCSRSALRFKYLYLATSVATLKDFAVENEQPLVFTKNNKTKLKINNKYAILKASKNSQKEKRDERRGKNTRGGGA